MSFLNLEILLNVCFLRLKTKDKQKINKNFINKICKMLIE
jgi:hypothetical protein